MGLAAEPKQDAAGLPDCGRTKPGAVGLRSCLIASALGWIARRGGCSGLRGYGLQQRAVKLSDCEMATFPGFRRTVG